MIYRHKCIRFIDEYFSNLQVHCLNSIGFGSVRKNGSALKFCEISLFCTNHCFIIACKLIITKDKKKVKCTLVLSEKETNVRTKECVKRCSKYWYGTSLSLERDPFFFLFNWAKEARKDALFPFNFIHPWNLMLSVMPLPALNLFFFFLNFCLNQ